MKLELAKSRGISVRLNINDSMLPYFNIQID